MSEYPGVSFLYAYMYKRFKVWIINIRFLFLAHLMSSNYENTSLSIDASSTILKSMLHSFSFVPYLSLQWCSSIWCDVINTRNIYEELCFLSYIFIKLKVLKHSTYIRKKASAFFFFTNNHVYVMIILFFFL